MAAGEVHVFAGEVGGAHALVAGCEFGFFRELFEFLDEDGSVGKPEGEARPDIFVEGEEFEFAAQLAVVTFARLFEKGEVGLQFGFVFESGAVDALELRIAFVALVIGAGHMGEAECADVASAHDMGSGAEVQKVTVSEQGDLFVVGDVLDDVGFEAIGCGPFGEGGQTALLGEFEGFVAGDDEFFEGMVCFDFEAHLLLDLGEVLRRDAVGQIDVVVEAVFHGGTGGELGFGPDFEDGGGEDVGGGVAEPLQISHLLPLLESFAFFSHGKGVDDKSSGRCRKGAFLPSAEKSARGEYV